MAQNFGQVGAGELLNDVFSGYNSVQQSSFSVATLLEIDGEHIPSSDNYTLNLDGSVTVNFNGTVEVDCDVTLRHLGGVSNNRTRAESWVERDGVEILGTRCDHYLRQANFGATGTSQFYVAVTVGDAIRVMGQRTGGTGEPGVPANGLRLALRRL